MGAHAFFTYAFGKTANDAFRAAVEQAQWDYGHGGYTGTIAEKRDFVLLPKPSTRLSTRALADCAIGDDDHYIIWRKLKKGEDGNKFASLRCGMDKSGNLYKVVAERKKLPTSLLLWVKDAHEAVGDKWGPAGCVEITGKDAQDFRKREGFTGERGKVFLFFGWASS